MQTRPTRWRKWKGCEKEQTGAGTGINKDLEKVKKTGEWKNKGEAKINGNSNEKEDVAKWLKITGRFVQADLGMCSCVCADLRPTADKTPAEGCRGLISFIQGW